MRKISNLLIILLAQTSVWAQPQLVNISKSISSKNLRTSQTTTKKDSTTLKLPFLENFIKYDSNLTPTNALWKSGTGVKVSPNMTKNSPDLNAAIFDGTDANNTPYNYSNPNQRGITDSLVSHKIDLSAIKLSTLGKDSVFGLTYFVQNGGYSEKADGRQGDYLKLLFKNINGNWDQVWIRKDSVPSTNDTLIVDKSYKEFFDYVYKPYKYLNNFDDSVKFVKRVYPLVANYDSSSTVLKDSMTYFYNNWTGTETFNSTNDSIDFYKIIYRKDVNYLTNYKNFFANVYHSNVNYKTQKDSIDYFSKIYPNNLYPAEYYKDFFNLITKRDNFYDVLTVKYSEVSYLQRSQITEIKTNFKDKADSLINNLKVTYKRDSLLLYRKIVSLQNKNSYGNYSKYFYKFSMEDSAKYFHNQFRMAFVANGRRSGSFDIWGLDCVHLRIGKLNRGVIYDADYAVTGNLPSIFKEYSTIPKSHYKNNITAKDSITAYYSNIDISNVGSSNAITYKVFGDVKNTNNSVEFTGTQLKDLNIVPYKLTLPDTIKIDTNKTPTVIFSQLFVSDDEILKYKLNDTITKKTILEDNYSYDDGSAERAFQISGKYTELALQYHTYKKDTLTSINIHFPKIIKSNDGTTITLKIWREISKDGNGRRNDSIYYKKNVVIEYDSLDTNEFQNFKLTSTKPIIVSDSFYVGFELTTADPVYLGYDLSGNINSAKKIKFNASGNWETYNGNGGNLMINPVFGKFTISNTARNGENDNSNDYYFYPNPISNGQTTINGEMPVKIEVYDMRGIAVENYKLDVNTGKLETNNLPKGIYMVKITGPSIYVGKKIIVE